MDFCERQSMGMSVSGRSSRRKLRNRSRLRIQCQATDRQAGNDYRNERVSPGESMRLKKDR
jgi:hypothetical protein